MNVSHPRQPLLEDELLHAQEEQGPRRRGDVTGLYKMDWPCLGGGGFIGDTWEPLSFGEKPELFVV